MSRRIMIDQIAFDEAVDLICKEMVELDQMLETSEDLIRVHVEGILSLAKCLRMELFDTDKSLTNKTV